MITPGIIKEINLSAGSYKNNVYKVEVPIFNNPSKTNDKGCITVSTAALPGGLYSSYQVGDYVYIGFVNNDYQYPVILGRIYKGLTDETRSFAKLDSLEVKEKVVLPTSTVIGQITYEKLYNAVFNGVKGGSIVGGYLKAIVKDTTNQTITITDSNGVATTFPYGGGGGTYTPGYGINIVNNEISVNTTVIATKNDISILENTKLDKDLSILTQVNPSSMDIDQIENMRVYIDDNGTAKYAKLNELGFNRVRNQNDISQAGFGDLILDMN